MTSTRPPLPFRWEFHLGAGLLGLLLSMLRDRFPDPDFLHGDRDDPAVVSRRARQEAVRAAHPWLAQLERERAWTRALLALWLAGRSYQLERNSRRSDPA